MAWKLANSEQRGKLKDLMKQGKVRDERVWTTGMDGAESVKENGEFEDMRPRITDSLNYTYSEFSEQLEEFAPN